MESDAAIRCEVTPKFLIAILQDQMQRAIRVGQGRINKGVDLIRTIACNCRDDRVSLQKSPRNIGLAIYKSSRA